jgi:tryptophanase
VFQTREQLQGLRIIDQSSALRHFTARFEEITGDMVEAK